jgi:hypothetical protein
MVVATGVVTLLDLAGTSDTAEPDVSLSTAVPVSAVYGKYNWDNTSGAFTAAMQGQSDGKVDFLIRAVA